MFESPRALAQQGAELSRRDRDRVIIEVELQHVAVVVSQVTLEVRSSIERPPTIGENILKRRKVQALGIREDTVKVEHDREGIRRFESHLILFAGSFSPAGIATSRRFSRGGTGQIQAGL